MDGARILQFNDPTGDLNNYIVLTHDSHLNQPYGLAFGPNGLLYVANSGDGSVLRFDANGAYVDTFLTGLVAPQFLTFTETADITPEPGTWALVGATLMFCAGKRMRRGLGTADSHGRRW